MTVIEHLVPTAEASTHTVSERPINARKKQSNLKSKGEYQTTARLKTALDPIVNNDSENPKVKSDLYHSQRALSFKLGNERRSDGYTRVPETPNTLFSTSSRLKKQFNLNWFSLVYKAFSGENSQDIIISKYNNRKQMPFGAAFSDGFNISYEFINNPLSSVKNKIDNSLYNRIEIINQQFKKTDLSLQEYTSNHMKRTVFQSARIITNILLPGFMDELGFSIITLLSGTYITKPILQESILLYRAYNLHKKSDIKHIFSKRNGKEKSGHLSDTLLNRREIFKTASNKNNFLGKDQWGNKWYSETQADGKQVWAVINRSGQLKSGGVNEHPRTMHPEFGLCKPSKSK